MGSKGEENLQIQAELETVKARYMERVGATWMAWRGKSDVRESVDHQAAGSAKHGGSRGALCKGNGQQSDGGG